MKPLCHTLAFRDPLEIAERLADRPGFVFLDSTGDHGTLGRHSVIGVEPFGVLAIRNGVAG
ncbi:MAG: hypothetical protein JNK88_07840 [Mangrovicoccus sp.]|nr:hypothetical protein [Mangrovicoccus sp.]